MDFNATVGTFNPLNTLNLFGEAASLWLGVLPPPELPLGPLTGCHSPYLPLGPLTGCPLPPPPRIAAGTADWVSFPHIYRWGRWRGVLSLPPPQNCRWDHWLGVIPPDLPLGPLSFVELLNSGLERLDEDSFRGTKVQTLRLMSNRITWIHPHAFRSVTFTEDPLIQGRTQDFLKGVTQFFPCIVASRVRKINFT